MSSASIECSPAIWCRAPSTSLTIFEWKTSSPEDGGVYVRYDVTDPNWAVGHTLQYGADAEIVEPEEIRDLVRDVLGRIEA